jgi:hypothetical protein
VAAVDSRDSVQPPEDSTSAKGPLSSPTATHSELVAHDTARIAVGWGLEMAHGATQLVQVVADFAAGASTQLEARATMAAAKPLSATDEHALDLVRATRRASPRRLTNGERTGEFSHKPEPP